MGDTCQKRQVASYEEAVDYLLQIPRFTKKRDLSHTRELLHRLGDPQKSFGVIHVAGSNGKGSVCAYLESVLREAGLFTGLFTSPHLVDIRERIQWNGKICSKEEFLSAVNQVLQAVEKMEADGFLHPAFFDILFAVALVSFRQAGVTVAILETGLGGRLDATNVVEEPILTVLTSISLDHTEILGGTCEAIAKEKAGILKARVPLVYDATYFSTQEEEKAITGVIEEQAKKLQVPLYPVRKKEELPREENRGKSFLPEYQLQNRAVARCGIRLLQERFSISEEQIEAGLNKAYWPGRMEETEENLWMDGAHNPAGIKAFLEAVPRITDEKAVLLFSMVQDKAYEEVIREIVASELFSDMVLTEISDNPRALSLRKLQQTFQRVMAAEEGMDFSQENASGKDEKQLNNAKVLPNIFIEETPSRALQLAKKLAVPQRQIFCTGSLYLIGELKRREEHD